MHFHVANIQPPPFNVVFDDLAKLLVLSLNDLGHAATAAHGPPRPDSTNIILGYSGAPDPAMLRGHIIYQLEPLSFQNAGYTPQWLDRLQFASEVWDYSTQNLEFLRAQEINPKLVPIGFHPALATIQRDPQPQIDVLHYGNCSPRRAAVVRELMSKCRAINLAFRFGPERDRYIAASKIILNLHYFEGQSFEAVRVSYLLNNGCFVIAEDSPDNPYQGAMVTAPYDQLVETCLSWLNRPAAERDQIARAGLELFQRMPMTEHLRAALGSGTQ